MNRNEIGAASERMCKRGYRLVSVSYEHACFLRPVVYQQAFANPVSHPSAAEFSTVSDHNGYICLLVRGSWVFSLILNLFLLFSPAISNASIRACRGFLGFFMSSMF